VVVLVAAVVDVDTYILGKDRDETKGEQRKPGELDVHHFVERKPIDQKKRWTVGIDQGKGRIWTRRAIRNLFPREAIAEGEKLTLGYGVRACPRCIANAIWPPNGCRILVFHWSAGQLEHGASI